MKACVIGICLLSLTGCIPSVRIDHPLIEAAKSGNINLIKAGIGADKSLANLKREDGIPLIYFAAVNRHNEIVTYLLDMGVDVNTSDEVRLLSVAVNSNNLELVKLLLQRGAKVNLPTKKGKSVPIHGACNSENPEIVRLLIAHGAKVSSKSADGQTPLHRCQNKAVAEVLIKYGASVNAKDANGYTPLHWFATPREIIDKPTIEYLLSQGADLNARDNQGLTPRELAQKNKQWELIKILDAHAKPNL